ncbi:hypothetical protein C5167_009904 [Papaver somniferum]|uniref:Uncharacterized protein n=1 Tax=Papaver somniferum TaxID=3469 RepID=A0A4Y7JYP3_PAPSO|nr:hypothetical protein C5167_009904 [Papaver somniferum]
MVDYPYPSDFLMHLPANPIKEVCRKIDDHPQEVGFLDRILSGVSIGYNYTWNEWLGLAVLFFFLFPFLKAWTEMVMPISSSKISGMSPAYDFNHSSFQNPCFKDYAVQPRNRWISTDFDGQDLNMTLKTFWSNIIFSNGVLDPWSSVLQNVSETIIALVTKLGELARIVTSMPCQILSE